MLQALGLGFDASSIRSGLRHFKRLIWASMFQCYERRLRAAPRCAQAAYNIEARPQASKPRRKTLKPRPETSKSKPKFSKPEPKLRSPNPKPWNPNPKNLSQIQNLYVYFFLFLKVVLEMHSAFIKKHFHYRLLLKSGSDLSERVSRCLKKTHNNSP